MKDIADILPHIDQYAPGCPAPTAYFGIRQAAIDFCERTRLWRYEDDFDIPGDESESITTPYGSVLHEIELVQFDDEDLEPQTTDWLDKNCRGWRANELTGQPSYVVQTEPNTLRVVPWVAGHINLFLWLKPSQDATELPDFIIDQYRETIAHGALARILMMPGQPFSNPNLAGTFGALFTSKLDTLMRASARGQQRGRTRTRAHFM